MTLISNNKRIIQDVSTLPINGESRYIYHNTTDGFFYYWNDVTNSYIKLDFLDVITTVQPTPSTTGNTTNLNSVFKDASGNTWIVDSKGDAILCGAAPFKNLNEFHVDPNGNNTTGDGSQEKPFQTITKALSVVSQADQVIVHAGVYSENITISTPNIALVGAQSEYGSLTQINGSVTISASGTSVKISDLTITSLVDSGTGDVYLNNSTINSTLSSSAGYIEIRNSSIQDGTITKSGGSMLIENSKIDNVTVSGTNTSAIIRDSYQDGNSTITYGAGTIYGIYNVQGGEIVINAAAVPVETAALAQGLSAEMAKEAETSDFQKIGILRPDTETSPTQIVTWDEITKRIEVSPIANVSGDKYKTVSTTCQDIVSTGNITLTVATGLAYTPLQDIIVYADVSNHMHGQVVSYNNITGVLVIDVHQKSGAGNFCNWTVNLDAIKIAEVSVYEGTNDPIASGQTGVEGDIWLQKDTNGNMLKSWIYNGTAWVVMDEQVQVLGSTEATPASTGNTTNRNRIFKDSTGDTWYVDGLGNAIKCGSSTQLITTSLTPQVYLGTAYTNARADVEANVADVIVLSDGTYLHSGKVTWTGHGLTVGAWYYLSQTTDGVYTDTKPTIGLVQQLFFVEDANTVHIDIEEAWNLSSGSLSFAKLVYFNSTDPSTGTIFDTVNPPTTNDNSLKNDINNLYIGTDGKTWSYNSTTNTYSTYTQPASTEWYFQNTTNDAGSDKTNPIWRAAAQIGIGGFALQDSNTTLYQTSTAKGLTLTGTPVTFQQQSNGARWVLGVNLSNNVQHWFGDYNGLTGTTINSGYEFVRFIHIKDECTVLDALGSGGARKNIHIGQEFVGIGGARTVTWTGQPLYNGHVRGTFGVDNLPDYSTATKVLVKNTTTSQVGTKDISSLVSVTPSAEASAPNSSKEIAKVNSTSIKETVTNMFVNANVNGPTVAIYYNEEGNNTEIPGVNAITTTQSVPTTTGNTSNLNSVFLATDGNSYFVDANGDALNIGSPTSPVNSYTTTVYFNSTNPSTATIFDLENPPATNDDTLKANDQNIYIGTDNSMWTYNTSTSTYNTYTIPATTLQVLRVAYTSPVSLANGGYFLGFNNISFNTIPTTWNNSTGTFTAQTTGFYMVALAVSASANVVTGQFLEVAIMKNGSTEQSFLAQANAAGNYNLCLSGAVPVYLAANDTIRFRIGSSLTFLSHVNSTYFSITQIK